MTTLKRAEEIMKEVVRDRNYDKAGEIVSAIIEIEDYCGYKLQINECDIYLGGDDDARAWFIDEGGFNAPYGDHSISEIARMLQGLEESDDRFGFYCLDVYGWLHFIDFLDAINEMIINNYIVDNEEAAAVIIKTYEEK